MGSIILSEFLERASNMRPGFDVRLAEVTTAIGGVSQLVLPNPNRVTLIVSTSAGVTGVVRPERFLFGALGFLIPTTSPLLIIDFSSWGPFVCNEWFGSATAGAIDFTVGEVIWRGVTRR